MRAFLAALLLCYGAIMPVLVLAPMQSPASVPAKMDGRAPFDMAVQKSEPPRDDDVVAAYTFVDQRVVVASLAPPDQSIFIPEEPRAPLPVSRPAPPPAPKVSLLEKAQKFVGTNPTGWASLWCARFIAMLAPDLAAKVDNPNWARDWADLPHTKNPKPGDIAVLRRGRGGHIGVVKTLDRNGNPILISGNTSGRRGHRVVAEGKFSKSRVIAYVRVAEL